MKILIVSCVDDNFGDNLIRICFEKLLRAALINLGVDLAEVELAKMSLKTTDRELIRSSDLLFFAGGGLFGINYMHYYDYMEEITGVTPENEHLLSELLRRSCFYAVSVRENPALFRRYAEGCPYEIVEVCDPAVWSAYIYYSHLKKRRRPEGKSVVGSTPCAAVSSRTTASRGSLATR